MPNLTPKLAPAPEGFFVERLGFTDRCDCCPTVAQMLSFSVKTNDGDEFEQEFTISDFKVCSFECFKKTIEYHQATCKDTACVLCHGAKA